AEDGIRDFHVTGVQTCALPILTTGLDRLANRRLVSPLRRCRPSIGAGYVLAELTLLLESLQLGVSDLLFELGLALSGLLAFAGKDRKSTRLNSSHVKISYAVFC